MCSGFVFHKKDGEAIRPYRSPLSPEHLAKVSALPEAEAACYLCKPRGHVWHSRFHILYPEVRNRLVLAASVPSGPFTTAVQRRALSAVCAAALDCDVLPEEPSWTIPDLFPVTPREKPSNPQVEHPLTVSLISPPDELLAALVFFSWKDAVMVVVEPDITGLGLAFTSASSKLNLG